MDKFYPSSRVLGWLVQFSELGSCDRCVDHDPSLDIWITPRTRR
jgi:hypothetical protein